MKCKIYKEKLIAEFLKKIKDISIMFIIMFNK